MGLNYASHLGGRPPAEYPGIFAKLPSSIVGPGDGTTAAMQPGDVVEVEVEGVGVLRNPVVKAGVAPP